MLRYFMLILLSTLTHSFLMSQTMVLRLTLLLDLVLQQHRNPWSRLFSLASPSFCVIYLRNDYVSQPYAYSNVIRLVLHTVVACTVADSSVFSSVHESIMSTLICSVANKHQKCWQRQTLYLHRRVNGRTCCKHLWQNNATIQHSSVIRHNYHCAQKSLKMSQPNALS